MFLWAVIVTQGKGQLIQGPETVVGSRAFTALQALNAVIGLFSSLAVNSEFVFPFKNMLDLLTLLLP